MYQDTKDYFHEFAGELPSKVTYDKGHGRIEKREYRLLTTISWLEQKDEWCGLKALGMVKSTVTEKGEIHEFTRYFITSLTHLKEFANLVRKREFDRKNQWSMHKKPLGILEAEQTEGFLGRKE